ncbi:hypothetical protein O181_029870 [Austropuccinia psidii MF-1]|uniref:Transposase Tc1-like domain-containing protein n=1 Tax=Austropuccinia psidii MF-1 TaxID=1389203 RepID=A0A9Q3CV73_9BASI|nr:hypothetical protein [Austropuccinia psidii MF-1]
MRQAGVPIRGISNAMHVAKLTVWGIINCYNQQGHCKDNDKPGWHTILDDNNCADLDAYLVDHQRATLAELVNTIPKAISSRTVSKEIHNLGKRLCVAPKKPYLQPINFTCCLEFAQRLHVWNPHQWGRIIWTDECSFELGKKSDQVRVW